MDIVMLEYKDNGVIQIFELEIEYILGSCFKSMILL
jgi:hypothetical protein